MSCFKSTWGQLSAQELIYLQFTCAESDIILLPSKGTKEVGNHYQERKSVSNESRNIFYLISMIALPVMFL